MNKSPCLTSSFDVLIIIEMHLQLSAIEFAVFIYAFRVSARYELLWIFRAQFRLSLIRSTCPWHIWRLFPDTLYNFTIWLKYNIYQFSWHCLINSILLYVTRQLNKLTTRGVSFHIEENYFILQNDENLHAVPYTF